MTSVSHTYHLHSENYDQISIDDNSVENDNSLAVIQGDVAILLDRKLISHLIDVLNNINIELSRAEEGE